MKGPRNTKTTAAAFTAAAVVLCLLVLAGGAAALGAADSAPPTGAVGGVRSPASGILELRLYASDEGSGLASAEAQLDSVSPVYLRLGTGECPEHPAPGSEPPPGSCPGSVAAAAVPLDTRSVADGERSLRVRVTDGAGNVATLLDRAIVVRNAPPTGLGPIATVTIGLAGNGPGGGSGGGGGSSGGGKGRPPSPPGKGHGGCRKPKLKMHLASKPLWRTLPRHVPVLRYGRRYPYRGKLTCLAPSGKRVSASKGTAVGVYYRVWQRSFKRPKGPVKYVRKRTIRVRKKGRLKLKLSFRSGRTVLFRYHGPRKELAKAKLRLAVPPRTRKPPWGPR
jgi:hypothetical protein